MKSDKPKVSNVQSTNEGLKSARNFPVNERHLLNSLLDNIPEYIYFKDTDSRFIRISKSHAKVFGLKDPAEAIGKTDYDFFSVEHARLAFEGEQEIIRTGRTLSIEEKETWANQPDTWVLTTKMPMFNEEEKIIGIFGISRDITARKIAEEGLRTQASRLLDQIEEINLLQDQLKDQATHDSLTGLHNRRTLDENLSQQLLHCQQFNLPFSIVVIDIDEFKKINDEFGHQIGDALLVEYGKCLHASTRADDFACRLGGDEFLLAFQRMSSEEAEKKADIIRQKLNSISINSGKQKISTTASLGIATSPMHGKSINELINRADEALYLAKENGRNRVVLAQQHKPLTNAPGSNK